MKHTTDCPGGRLYRDRETGWLRCSGCNRHHEKEGELMDYRDDRSSTYSAAAGAVLSLVGNPERTAEVWPLIAKLNDDDLKMFAFSALAIAATLVERGESTEEAASYVGAVAHMPRL